MHFISECMEDLLVGYPLRGYGLLLPGLMEGRDVNPLQILNCNYPLPRRGKTKVLRRSHQSHIRGSKLRQALHTWRFQCPCRSRPYGLARSSRQPRYRQVQQQWSSPPGNLCYTPASDNKHSLQNAHQTKDHLDASKIKTLAPD